MFKNLFRKRSQPKECSLHSDLSAEERNAKALENGNKLRHALTAACPRMAEIDTALGWILFHSSVADVIPDTDMDVTYLFFPKPQMGGRQIMGLTWDWIEARDQDMLAEHIINHLQELIAQGDLPKAHADYRIE